MGRMRRVGAVVAVGCLLLTGCSAGGGSDGSAASAAGHASATTPPTGQAGGVEGEPFPGKCVNASHIDTTPVTQAPGSRWMSVQGIRVPLTEAGPFEVDGYRQRCFSPSLAGAVAAAANIGLRQAGGNPAMTWTYKYNTIPAQSDAQAATKRGVGWLELHGWRIDKVSGDGKHVSVFLGVESRHDSQPVHVGIMSPVVWDGTDWKIDWEAVVAASKEGTDGEAFNGSYHPWEERP